MSESRHDESPDRVLADPEVPVPDALEQGLPVDPDARPAPPRSVAADPEVPAADAWEQALPADVFDDY